METVSLDIAPKQIVRWLKDEKRSGRLPVEVRAARSFVAQEPAVRIEPLDEITAVGTLEVTPLTTSDGWSLNVRVEDDAGPRLPEDEPVPEGEEEIDLDTFDSEFMTRDRGIAFVSVDVEDSRAMARFRELFESILTNIHPK